MVEVRFSTVLQDEAWELSGGKGDAAEGMGPSHGTDSWADAEYAADCHEGVERYHRKR